MTVLRAKDGYVLTKDGTYSDKVFLSDIDSEKNWESVELGTIMVATADEDGETEPFDWTYMYCTWEAGNAYEKGDHLLFDGTLYTVLQAHTSQSDWTPDASPSLFAEVLAGQDGTGIGEWVQPDSTNPYMKGDKVTHNGKTWESTIDNNVWEPGVYGWKEDSTSEPD